LAEGAVWPVVVVVLLKGAEDCRRVLPIDDQDAIEEFAAKGADESFSDCVGPTVPEPVT
jgi:hypothetical protein